MLISRSYAWTGAQKWLIASAAAVALAASVAAIFWYERHYRGPSEAVFLGTWHDTTQMMDSTTYYRFRPHGTFDLITDGMGSIDVVAIGKWYAGGENIYMRVPPPDDGTPTRPYVWHIVDISPEKILVRDTEHGAPVAWERVHDALPTASN